ncbi:killer cell lectin-like receptor subfamily F member 1 [Emydura macquarii macquarii]|uniref:killer cell lectin-like receptor subfamily F member 1 n=1 Tax=Emydura macquarii macquarii TaxID=1129001 RepID=UPI00352B3050
MGLHQGRLRFLPAPLAGLLSFRAVCAMAGNVIYADLNIPEAQLPCSSQPHNFRQCPRWHPLILKIGVAGYVVLLVAVLVLSVLLFQGSSDSGVAPEDGGISERPRNESKCITSLENLSDLKQHLCDPPQSSSTEGAKCVLCPRDWLPYKGKCYWVSKETKRWTSSHEDCLMKRSHLLVTQDPEELGYVQTITTEKNSVWIGLNFKIPKRTWIWVDGSPFNEKLFLTVRPNERDCGVLKRNQIAWETCSAELKWICQKEALLI